MIWAKIMKTCYELLKIYGWITDLIEITRNLKIQVLKITGENLKRCSSPVIVVSNGGLSIEKLQNWPDKSDEGDRGLNNKGE